MFKKVSPVVVTVLLVVVSLLSVFIMRRTEGFSDSNNSTNSNITKMVDQMSTTESGKASTKVVAKEHIDRAARAAVREYCPVPPDYNPSLYIKKTEIKKELECPAVPNMKDYVLKSSIPPPRDCPPCICPKVNVSAGLCKDGKKEGSEVVCPPPKPCGVKECKSVVKCPAPMGISQELDDDTVKKYVNELITDKDYKKINKLKNLLDSIETPSDIVEDLQEENEKLRKKIKKLELKSLASESNKTRMAGVMSNNRKATNSPVVDYNYKCQNNRVSNWYDVSGIIGSVFNSNNDPSNENNLVNNANNNVNNANNNNANNNVNNANNNNANNSVNNNVDNQINLSNNMNNNETFMNRLY